MLLLLRRVVAVLLLLHIKEDHDWWSSGVGVVMVHANPQSEPYLPFYTDPIMKMNDELSSDNKVHHVLDWTNNADGNKKSTPRLYNPDGGVDDADSSFSQECPLQFSLGLSRKLHHSHHHHNAKHNSHRNSIVRPPISFPLLPQDGPGRQVLYTTHSEQLDLLTSSSRGGDDSSKVKANQKGTTTSVPFSLMQHVDFPLLFESSTFLTSPLVGDVNGDGILDAVLCDYDGGIYAIGLQQPSGKRRYVHKAQVPRLYVRRQWMESKVNATLGIPPPTEEESIEEENVDGLNETEAEARQRRRRHSPPPHDPYHSYFEYSYGDASNDQLLRGVTANVLEQESSHATALDERRKQQDDSRRRLISADENESNSGDESNHRRLQEEQDEPQEGGGGGQDTEGGQGEADGSDSKDMDDGLSVEEMRAQADDFYYMGGDRGIPDDDQLDRSPFSSDEQDDDAASDAAVYGDDDVYGGRGRDGFEGDDGYPGYDDEYPRYDDYYGRYDSSHTEYYDDKHYVRIPPHILAEPVLALLPKLYSQKDEHEYLLIVPVSYYLDEDESEGFMSYKRFENTDFGDETEVQRGQYVASALMIYHYGNSPRWGRQEHLDLSGDFTAPVNSTLVGELPIVVDERSGSGRMGAFALGSPTVADLDGDGSADVLIATSMGMVYCMDAQNLYKKENWPVQFPFGIEHRPVVEDIRGDTNLEILIFDTGGNIACLDHQGKKLWHRNLPSSIPEGTSDSIVLASSPMVLGDINNDGILDVVVAIEFRIPGIRLKSVYLFALSADSGTDLDHFPVMLHSNQQFLHVKPPGPNWIHAKLPPPLLIDLHSNHLETLEKYIRRNGTVWTRPADRSSAQPLHGGKGHGLHVIQPYGSALVIMEGSTGCMQSTDVGEEVTAMVQADDLHGTNKMDLIVTTASGAVLTLQSSAAAPFHPLNVWNHGEVRGSVNSFAHGYSASQGIFVHDVSRHFRDIFGVYVPITFEIFDNRPNIRDEPNRRVYKVEVLQGVSKAVFRKTYDSTGVFTERLFIPDGPGYYTLTVSLKTTHGLVYQDSFHVGYNVHYMDGFGMLLWLPLLIGSACILLFGNKTNKSHWDDDDFTPADNDQRGILPD